MLRITAIVFVALGLILAGCGGKSSSAPTTSSTETGGPKNSATTRQEARRTREEAKIAKLPVKSTSYLVTLVSGREVPPGSPKGSAVGLISMNATSNELCWSFTQLKNVLAPTEASIVAKLSFGYTSTPLGTGFQPSGCQLVSRLLLYLMETRTRSFTVQVLNSRHTGRAVRGRL